MKGFFKKSFILALQPFITKITSYFVIPLYTLSLTPGEYGQVEFILMIGIFFKTFISMSTTSSFWKFISEKDTWNPKEVVFNVLFIPLSLGCIVIFAGILFYFIIGENEFLNYNTLICTISETISIFFLTTNLLVRFDFKVRNFFSLVGGYIIFFIATHYIFLYFLELKVIGVLWSYLLTNICIALLCLYILKPYVKIKINKILLKEILYYSFPLMVTNIVAIIMNFSNRYIIQKIDGDYSLGLFSYGYKFGSVVKNFVVDTFFIIWNPIRWNIYHRENAKSILSLFSNTIIVFFPIVGLSITLIIIQIAYLITKSPLYIEGFSLIPIVALAYIVYGIAYFNNMGLLFSRKTNVIFYITLGVAILNIILTIVGVKTLSFIGAGIAIFISYFCMAILSLYFSQKNYKLSIPAKKGIYHYSVLLISGILLVSTIYFEINFTYSTLLVIFFLIITQIKDIYIFFKNKMYITIYKYLNENF